MALKTDTKGNATRQGKSLANQHPGRHISLVFGIPVARLRTVRDFLTESMAAAMAAKEYNAQRATILRKWGQDPSGV